MRTLCSRPFAVASLAIGALTLSALQTQGAEQTQGADLTQTNLVSDITGLAKITDPQLVNPWGVSHSPTSPFWTSNQGKNTATLEHILARGIFAPHGEFDAVRSLARSASAAWYWRDRSKIAPVIVVQQAAAILFVRWTYSTQNELPLLSSLCAANRRGGTCRPMQVTVRIRASTARDEQDWQGH